MLFKILKKDFLRKKIITIVLFTFILLSALLVASGSNMIMELFNSLDFLFEKSLTPHFMQMHSGEIDQSLIDAFVAGNSMVKEEQTVEMLNIDGFNVSIGHDQSTEEDSVMDLDFVKQNKSFDFLLNLKNEVIRVARGEIAVPIYFMQQKKLQTGDKVRIADQGFEMEFTIVEFVRDAQMNPSIVHSKRFVVNDSDYEILKANLGEVEYLIEFLLKDFEQLSEFDQAYQTSNLPKKGPVIDSNLFKTLNVITDGIVSVVVILVSLLLITIALLCLRFTILATMEEDYREIGVMKALGIPGPEIKKLYLVKYVVMAGLASVIGYMASLFLNRLFTANIMLYIGAAPENLLQKLIPLIAVGIIFLFVVLFCRFVLRRFDKVSAVEALRAGNIGESKTRKTSPALYRNRMDVNIFLGLRDVFKRMRMFWILFLVFFICSFIIIVPVNFLNTIQAPEFISYMGIGRSDIRIDLRQTDNIALRFDNMVTSLENDRMVERFSPLVTCRYKVINSDGILENINVETGDFSIFPLQYLHGTAPTRDNEIALSYLNAQNLGKDAGDKLKMVIEGREREMTVSGIYQDVTNGGRTAKAFLPINPENVLWYVVSLDVKPGTDIEQKIDEYGKTFYPARVTHLQGYLAQTLGNTIEQLKLFTLLAVLIAIFVSILITFLFLKMLVAKDYSQIAIMKSIGLSLKDIRVQYITKTLLVLNIGIILGAIVSNTIGQGMVSALWSFMGASKITFVINPVEAYVLCPLVLISIVTITTLISILSIKRSSITEMIME